MARTLKSGAALSMVGLSRPLRDAASTCPPKRWQGGSPAGPAGGPADKLTAGKLTARLSEGCDQGEPLGTGRLMADG